MNTRTLVMAILATATSAVNSGFAGGDRVDIRGMGMGRSSVASARGLDAVGVNPANLALKDHGLSLSIARVGVHAGSDFLTYGLYNEYFTGVETGDGRVGKYLDEPDKQRIINAFRGGVGEVTADASLRLVGLSVQFPSIGGFAFTMTDHLGGIVRVPSDYIRFVLYGNSPGSVYDFSRTSAKASWFREYALSFGGAIPHPSFMEWLSLGASVKLVKGFGYYEVDRFNTSLTTADNGTLIGRVGYLSRLAGLDPTREQSGFTLSPFGGRAFGHGTGFDLGIAGGIAGCMTVGISVIDMGQINWEEKIEETFADTLLVIDDPRDVQDGAAIENALKGRKREGTPFSRPLPTTLRAGVALQVQKLIGWIPGDMTFAADYTKGLVDAPGTTLYTRFSLGLEWKLLRFLPLRSGVSFGGTDRKNLAFGFGLHFGFFEIDAATENLELLWGGDDLAHASLAAGMRFRF